MPRILTAPSPAPDLLAWTGPGAGWAFFIAFALVVLGIGTALWWWGRRRRRPQDPT